MSCDIKGEGQKCVAVSWPVFRFYMAACGGSASCLIILVLFVFNVGSSAFCQWWLSYWINQGSKNTTITWGINATLSGSMKDNPMMQHYITIYASSMGVMLLFKLLRGVAFVKVTACLLQAAQSALSPDPALPHEVLQLYTNGTNPQPLLQRHGRSRHPSALPG
ncbi:hypothetical protein JOB18_015895 [Solea senegalensis]|uniref:Uncharacterized protein n=1 Tax=Solea senegalensis TaxID=28829 RepID=A0AAV6PZX4_SOLSE|nr:hypothetical protein JOB18_015895 [Solea senegalensis]